MWNDEMDMHWKTNHKAGIGIVHADQSECLEQFFFIYLFLNPILCSFVNVNKKFVEDRYTEKLSQMLNTVICSSNYFSVLSCYVKL